MSKFDLPPQYWFDAAREIISDAKRQIKVDDFKINAKLNPFTLGKSYTYRIDVLQQLIKAGVIILSDDKITLGSTKSIPWLNDAMTLGYSSAWELFEQVEGKKEESCIFDATSLKQIGDAGELFVIEKIKENLTKELHEKVLHIAKSNDAAGYDIYSPSINDSEIPFKIEVKTSTRNLSKGVEFFLSRNEFEVGRINRNWCIVFVSLSEGRKNILGHLYCYQIESRLPKDIDDSARWQSCKVFIEFSMLRDGLP